MRDLAPLDNPIWHALNEAHKPLASARGMAARYPADVSPFAGLRDYTQAAFDHLAALVEPGQTVALFTRQPVTVPPSWTLQRAVSIGQMYCDALKPQTGDAPLALTDADIPDMLDLVKRTEPGPFLPRTNCMGRYYGFRSADGRLMAMAGERLSLQNFTEISAVCTDPEFRGRGHAGILSTHVAQQVIAEGRVPFLHYRLDNPAQRLYERLGFTPRGTIELTIISR